MADPKIKLKRSSVSGKIPTPAQVPLGEVALNTFDGFLYASKNVGVGTTVIVINPIRVGSGTNTYNAFFTQGNLGIGTDNPTQKLDVDGDVIISGIVTASDFNSTSDIRLKTNIKTIDNPIEKVLRINGVSFDWKKDNKPSLGVIADNIQEVFPELVSDGDPKTVNYNGLIGLLIEVVKDQQEQIELIKQSLNKN